MWSHQDFERKKSLKVLLTGGLGFVGSYLSQALLDEGDDLTILDRPKPRDSILPSRDCDIVRLDIRDGESLSNYLGSNPQDAIVHLAAITGVARSAERTTDTFEANVRGTYNVAMGAKESESRLIFSSSREVYGNAEGRLSIEEDRLMPNNLYGLSKMLGENIICWISERFGLDYSILRFTNIYGPGGDQYNAQAMIRKALSEGFVEVFGGSQVLNLLHVDDATRAILGCLRTSRASREKFNVCGPDNISVTELSERIKAILHRFGKSISILKKPRRATDTEFNLVNIDKIRNTLDWVPRVRLDEGLEQVAQYYLEKNKVVQYAEP
jgi:UDP-glucose 4-epimerase